MKNCNGFSSSQTAEELIKIHQEDDKARAGGKEGNKPSCRFLPEGIFHECQIESTGIFLTFVTLSISASVFKFDTSKHFNFSNFDESTE